MITTSEKARFAGMEHRELNPRNAHELALALVSEAVENFALRNPEKVYIPVEPVDLTAGFSVEAIIKALGGAPDPLIDAMKAGTIRGAAGVVGCNNPKIKQDYGHVTLTQRLIENDLFGFGHGLCGRSQREGGVEEKRCGRHGRARPEGDMYRARRAAGASCRKLRG